MSTADWLLAKRTIDPASDCWIWGGYTKPTGYGQTYDQGSYKLVHRIAYEHWVGPIGELCVLHRCDNPPCFNPEHLFLGTQADNVADMEAKGRSVQPRGDDHWTRQQDADLQRGSGHHHARFTEDDVRAIRADTRTRGEIAATYGCSLAAIDHIRARRRWRHVA
jgi:HNH endonuclease